MHASPEGSPRAISLHGGRTVLAARVALLLSGLGCRPGTKRCVARKFRCGSGCDDIAGSDTSSTPPARRGRPSGTRSISGHDDRAQRSREP